MTPAPGRNARFAAAVTCIDGRVPEALLAWARKELDVDYVDMATQPGADRFVAEEDESALAGILRHVEVSRRAHGSTTVLVVAHHDCAGNPVDEAAHRVQVTKGVSRLRGLIPGMEVIGVWVGPDWTASRV